MGIEQTENSEYRKPQQKAKSRTECNTMKIYKSKICDFPA